MTGKTSLNPPLHKAFLSLLASGALLMSGLTAGCGSGSTPAQGPQETPPNANDPAVPDREDPAESCAESFDGAYDAIQTVIFERKQCANDSCHGSAAAGQLDLRADVSHQNLIEVPSQGSELLRVEPTKVKDSYLFQKVAARTEPSFVTIDLPGSAMPPNGNALNRNELEALRLWIEAGAPKTGSIGDEFGGNRVAELLDACLPAPEAVEVVPLAIPAPGTGVQLAMPPHTIPAATEFEVCFAEYIDLRDQIPENFQTADGTAFFANGRKDLADPNTHHMTLSYSGFGAEMIDAPEFGSWDAARPDLSRDRPAIRSTRLPVTEASAAASFGRTPHASASDPPAEATAQPRGPA